MLRVGFTILSVFYLGCAFSQHSCTLETKNAWKMALIQMLKADQSARKNGGNGRLIDSLDRSHSLCLQLGLSKYGWPSKQEFGDTANMACFVLAQHADTLSQRSFLPLLEASYRIGGSDAADYALLCDRVLMREGKPQRYGSQIVFAPDGSTMWYKTEDVETLNERRRSVGLEPIESYLMRFGIHPD